MSTDTPVGTAPTTQAQRSPRRPRPAPATAAELVLFWQPTVLTSWVSSGGQTEGLPAGHK